MESGTPFVVGSPRRLALAAFAFAAACLFCACSDDPIRVYEVPKEASARPVDPHAGMADPHAGLDMSGMSGGSGDLMDQPQVFGDPQRILAVTVPTNNGVWFFKLTGSKKTIETVVGEIDAFIGTVAFINEAPGIQFEAPASWSPLAPGMVATAKWELAERTIFSVTFLQITPFGDRELVDNVNRWRKQIGMRPVDLATIQAESRTVTVGQLQGTWTDLIPDGTASTGPGGSGAPLASSGSAGQAPATGGAGTGQGGVAGMTWTLPAGWQEVPSSSSVRLATFRANGVEIVITRFPGDVGGTLANVNRWRGQAGLPSVAPTELDSAMEALSIAGRDSYLVDAAGSSSRVLAAGIPTGSETWFVKGQGAPDAVGAVLDGFREFLATIQIGGN